MISIENKKPRNHFRGFFLSKKTINYVFLISVSSAFSIAWLFNFYFSINCSGVPDSPKLSCTATNSCGVGLFKANTPETLSPRPPR